MSAVPVERVVLFDGVCNLCNGFVQFVIRRDPAVRFRFAPMTGKMTPGVVLSESGKTTPGVIFPASRRPFADTVLLLENNRVYERSSAVLQILRRLRPPWPLLFALIVVPRPLRDWVYDVVARNRYRWFGRRETCMVPTPDVQNRFLERFEYPSERGT